MPTQRPYRPSFLMIALLAGALLAGCGDSPEQMLASAKEYLSKNDSSAAVIQLKNALQENNELAEARFLLGKIHFENGDFPSASKELKHAARLGYPADDVAPMLARALLKVGEREEVIRTFSNTALQNASSQSAVLVALGDARLGDDRAEAQRDYREALSADPDNALASVGLARIKATDGEIEQALSDIDALIEKAPRVAEAHALRAQLLFATNRADDALAAQQAAIELDNTNHANHYSYVSNLLALRRLDAAETGLAAMKQSVGATPAWRYLQAYIDFLKGDIEAARDGVQDVQKSAPDFVPTQLLAGAVYFRLNDQLLAQSNLSSVLRVSPNHPVARRLLVMSFLAQRDAQRAKEVLGPLLDSYPKSPEVLSLAGQVSLLAGDFDASSEYFSQVVGLQPEDAKARTRLGISQLAQGNLDKGLADLTTASHLDQNAGYADIAIIMTLLRDRQYEKALEAQQALEKKLPDSALTHNLKAGILLGKGDVSGARAALERALELQPTFLAAVTNLARLDVRDGNLDAARRRYGKVIDIDASNVGAHLALAELEMASGGSISSVRKHYENAISADPEAVAPKQRLVAYLLQTRQTKEALALAREMQVAKPNDAVTLRLLGLAQLAVGEHEQASASFQKLVERMPDRGGYWLDLGRAQLASGNMTGAKQSLARATTVSPQLYEAQRLLIAMHLRDKQFDEAVTSAKSFQQAMPSSGAGFSLEGDIEIARGMADKALPLYQTAFSLTPNVANAIKLHGSLVQNKHPAEAKAFAEKWVGEHPDDVLMRTYLGERAIAEGRLEDARTLYVEVTRLAPESAAVLNNLAWVADRLEDPEATSYIARALELAPDSAAVLDTAGMMDVRRGRVDAGIEKLEKAHQLAPSAVAISLNLATAYRDAGKIDRARELLDTTEQSLPAESQARNAIAELRASL